MSRVSERELRLSLSTRPAKVNNPFARRSLYAKMAKTQRVQCPVAGAKLTVASERRTEGQSVECRKPLNYAVLQMSTLSRTLGTSFAILHNPDWMRCQIGPMRPLNYRQKIEFREQLPRLAGGHCAAVAA
jgi:hypothetical protein